MAKIAKLKKNIYTTGTCAKHLIFKDPPPHPPPDR